MDYTDDTIEELLDHLERMSGYRDEHSIGGENYIQLAEVVKDIRKEIIKRVKEQKGY